MTILEQEESSRIALNLSAPKRDDLEGGALDWVKYSPCFHDFRPIWRNFCAIYVINGGRLSGSSVRVIEKAVDSVQHCIPYHIV